MSFRFSKQRTFPLQRSKQGKIIVRLRKKPYAVPLLRGRGIRGETKGVDIATTSTNITLSAVVAGIPLNLCVQGSDYNQHIGNKIAMKSLHLNATVQVVTIGGTAMNEAIRAMVVYDRQTNGIAPLWSDVIKGYTQASVSSNLTMDGINLNNRDRFSVLADFRYYMPAFTQQVGGSTVYVYQPDTPTMKEVSINRFIPLKNLETMFKGNTGGIADISSGGLFLLLQGQVGNQYSLDWTARLRFEDN